VKTKTMLGHQSKMHSLLFESVLPFLLQVLHMFPPA